MKIFSIKKRGVWHITKPNGTSYCSNARIDKDWYMEERVPDTVVIKERDDETLCNGCVGMAYKAGVIEVTDKEVGGMKKDERLAEVWKRKDEALKEYRSFEDGLELRYSYDLNIMSKLFYEYDVTLEEFQEYGRNQKLKEVAE